MEPVVERPAILRFVENWQRGWVPGTPGRLAIPDVQQLGLATSRARARYPGPVGELIEREIWAYTEFGHRFGGSGVVPRIVAELLADPVSRPGAAS